MELRDIYNSMMECEMDIDMDKTDPDQIIYYEDHFLGRDLITVIKYSEDGEMIEKIVDSDGFKIVKQFKKDELTWVRSYYPYPAIAPMGHEMDNEFYLVYLCNPMAESENEYDDSDIPF